MSNFKLASDYADKQEIISSLTLMDDLFIYESSFAGQAMHRIYFANHPG